MSDSPLVPPALRPPPLVGTPSPWRETYTYETTKPESIEDQWTIVVERTNHRRWSSVVDDFVYEPRRYVWTILQRDGMELAHGYTYRQVTAVKKAMEVWNQRKAGRSHVEVKTS